jgi:prevent-host-death family protein
MSIPEPSHESLGAYEAKVHFSELLQRVEAGAEVTITKHGSPVARMVPIGKGHSPAERRSAVKRLAKLRDGLTLGQDLSVRDLIAEGRR